PPTSPLFPYTTLFRSRVPRWLHPSPQFARSHHRGLVHRLRALRAELPLRQYQSASLRSSFGRSAKSRPQEGGHQAKGNLLRSLHALEGTQLRIRLSTRRSASRGSKIIFRRNAGGQWCEMRIDRTHRAWAIAAFVMLAAAAIVYL